MRTEVWPSAAPAHGRLSSLTMSCPPTGPASHPACGLRPQLGPDPPWGPFRQPGLPHNMVAELQKDILREPGLCPSWLALEVSHAGGCPKSHKASKGREQRPSLDTQNVKVLEENMGPQILLSHFWKIQSVVDTF